MCQTRFPRAPSPFLLAPPYRSQAGIPDFHPEAFDISFPTVETPRTSLCASCVRVARSQPSVQSFYASLEDFLTSHLHSDEPNRRSRFKSASTLLLTFDPDPPSKPAKVPSAEVDVVPPTPRTERPLPLLPREAYLFVDHSTLTKSASASPASGHCVLLSPPSPSWLSQNVHELEVALGKRLEASSIASS
jgi:hypothetical protein